MAYVLDIAAILILAFCVFRGARRGLVRTVLMLVGCLAAALAAYWLSAPVADFAYDTFIEARVEQSLVDQAQAAGLSSMEIPVAAVLGERAAPVADYLVAHGVPETVTIGFDDLSREGILRAAEPALRNVVRPALVGVLTALATVVLFFVMLLVWGLLVRLIDRVFRLPGLNQLNRIGGCLVGALVGVFWMVAFAAAVRLGAECGWFGSFITAETVERSLLVSRIGVSLITV